MKKIIIINGYYVPDKPGVGFSASFHTILSKSFVEAGYEADIITRSDCLENIRDSFLILIIKPENYYNVISRIHKSNFCVWWNIESISVNKKRSRKTNKDRLFSRRCVIDDVINNLDKYNTQHILFFNKEQCNLYNGQNCSFFPIGFHNCLQYDTQENLIKSGSAVFVGDVTPFRLAFFHCLKSIIRKNKFVFRRPSLVGHNGFVDFEQNKSVVSRYKFGVDYPALPNDSHIHWHRLMLYVANYCVIFTTSDLGEYGLIDGKHYFHCVGFKDFAAKMNNLYKLDHSIMQLVAKSMYDVVSANLSMVGFINREIDCLYEKWKNK